MFRIFLSTVFLGAIGVLVFADGGSKATYESQTAFVNTVKIKEPEVVHIKTPEPLKAVYMSACVAGTPSLRKKMVKLVEETELNALVIDIKDHSGTISFDTGVEEVDANVGPGCRVEDMTEFLKELKSKNIYAIGRIAVFQDPFYTRLHPELAVKNKSDGGVWKDRKGISFIDVSAKDFWKYIATIAGSGYKAGFDEINFDYIRFPSDGDMENTDFTWTGSTTKRVALKKFFEYIDFEMAKRGIPTSADIFGMTTSNTNDLGIGQVLEDALMHFDYVAPMVYPSHYPNGFNGWKDPNKVPYELIKFVMAPAVSRLNFLREEIASSTPSSPMLNRIKITQLRPWLQDNDYPIHYTPEMVRAQIKGTYDVGLTSWMLWDAGNSYTREALLKE